MKTLFYKFWENITDCFRGYNLLFQLGAFGITFIIVVSDFDWKYFLFFNGTILSTVLFSAALVGGLAPILVPIAILAYGKMHKNLLLLNTGFALGQAAILGYLFSSFYKIWSGRVGPPLFHLNSALLDTSKTFYFGFFRNGIFWGWPSSHTTIAFAMAFTLFTLYPKNKIIRMLSVIYALYIGIGVSMTIHWFSDFVAGAIIGTVIGVVVGKTFFEKQKLIV